MRAAFGGATARAERDDGHDRKDGDQRYGGEPPRTSARDLAPTCLTTGSPLLDVHLLRCSAGGY